MSRRLSGMQKEVLALYRSILRQACKKDREAMTESNRSPSGNKIADIPFQAFLLNKKGTTGYGASITSYAAQEFKRQANSVKRSDFKRIEYMLRKGQKQIKLMKMPGVHAIHGIV